MRKLFKKIWFGSGVVVNQQVAKWARSIGLTTYAKELEFIVHWQRKLANDEITIDGAFYGIIEAKKKELSYDL